MRLNKLAKKIFAAGLAVSLMMANAGVSFAATNYTPQSGSKTTIKKHLEMNNDASVPNVTFNYTIEAGEPIAAVNGKMAVFAGPTGDKAPSIGTAVFTANDTTAAKEGSTDTKVATKDIEVDFSGVSFSEPGIYRYTIKETAGNVAGITYDNRELTMDVYVIDKDGKLEVAEYVLHTGKEAPKANETQGSGDVEEDKKPLSDKVDGFTNTYATKNLTFRKEVKGNQASRDKYFAFTVTITNAIAGTKYDVDLGKADPTSGTNAATISENAGKTNATSITVPDGKTVVEATFYLQHGQEITIKGLAASKDAETKDGNMYTITENAEDYKSTPMGVEGYKDETRGVIVDKDIKTSYLNEKTGTIPTGVILDSAPFILIIGLAAAALVITAARKKVR